MSSEHVEAKEVTVTISHEGAHPKADAATIERLNAEVLEQGNVVRQLKQSGAAKEEVDAAVHKLLHLKSELAKATGEPDPSHDRRQDKKKKKDKAKATPRANPSKKKKAPPPKFEYVNKTPHGEKKDMSEEMLPSYQPVAVESAWNAWWEKSGFFTPDRDAAMEAAPEDKFVIMIPPPNVTGTLHLGHALTCSVEDTLVRWHRMSGKHVLWLPGTDHAGIATQVVVEKRLQKEEGKTRHDLGREEFLRRVWEWKQSHGDRITTQLRRLGASVDWSREVFTMDEPRSRAVTEAFVRLYDRGLIYRRTRLVNWCCALNTAISDIEVDYVDLEGRTMLPVPGHKGKREFGTLTEFAYKVEDSDEEIVVATTRLETMLGDTAVAVHPEDPRYKHLHGKHVVHPFCGRRIPIITDAELVDMSFGTGAVKITPAHDPNDFLCGQRHGLPEINIFADDGRVNDEGAQFKGLMRFDARVEVERELEKLGLLRGKKDNKMRLGLCSRSGDVIEPILKPQWWVDCSGMAAKAVKAVREGELRVVPDFHTDTWYRWLENIRDWCISRQLWWGHRIPAFYVVALGVHVAADASEEAIAAAGAEAVTAAGASDTERWVIARTEEEARATAAAKLGVPVEAVRLFQDPDVLDTWFSSALFPFATLGWPDESAPDLKAFYPGTLLETGHDILFFWVARMVMMGLELTGRLPFTTVYLHAMVRDKYGRKMSKSRGNVIDPLEVIEGAALEQLHEKLHAGNLDAREIEKAKKGQKLDFPDGIPECGADALRFGLLAYTLQGRDVNLDINRVVGYRQFCNKLWNATKFALMNLEGFEPTASIEADLLASPHLALRDRWILHRLSATCRAVHEHMSAYQFADVTTDLFNFWLYSLCDVYLELIKPVVYSGEPEAKLCAQRALWICLDRGLRLLHPLMPFVTEELWQRLPGRGKLEGDPQSIMLAAYPREVAAWDAPDVDARMETVLKVIHSVRSLRGAYSVPPSKMMEVYVTVADEETAATLAAQADDVGTLSRSTVNVLAVSAPAPDGCAVEVVDERSSVHAMLKGLLDVDAELAKLEKQMSKVDGFLAALDKKMSIPNYETRVPAGVRAKNDEKKAALDKERESIVAAMASMEKLRA